jgi:Xaa-Pro aminopeptidase
MLKNGADALSFDTIAVSGKNSSMPHGVPTDKKIEKGDFITMDYGAVCDFYHSDMTRTVAVGEVSGKQIEVYETVLKAQEEAFKVMKAGVPCKAVDKAARDIIVNKGYGDFFGHGLGHGVGVEIHELPSLNPSSSAILEVGNIVTNEPGIYLPGQFGVRIEDMALITEDGYENLTLSEKKLIIL